MVDLKYISDKTQFTGYFGDEGKQFDPKIPRIGEADALIKIGGDSDLSKFIPNVNIFKWASEKKPEGEFFLNINTVGVQKGDVKIFDDGVIGLEQGNIQHRYYPTVEKRPKLEYEMVFASKPSSLEIWFDILHSEELIFARQNVEDFIPGSKFASNVPGSYVVYTPAGGRFRNGKYRTGKLIHLYMSKLKDAIGRQIFVEKFEIEAGKMLIVLPGTWMENATYPVTLDPLVGTDSIGSLFFQNATYQILSRDNTATGTATATTAYVYTPTTENTGADVKIHLYGTSNNNATVDHTIEILEGAQAVNDWSSTVISWSVVADNAISLSTNLHGMRYDTGGSARYSLGLAYADHPESPFVQYGSNLLIPSVYIDLAAAVISFVPAPSVFKKRRHGLWTPNRKPPLQSRINWQHPIVRPADGETKPSLIACYLGNEGGGNSWFDIAGNNTGAFQNAPTWVPDQDGPAVEFDGGTAQIEVGSTWDRPITGLTVVASFKMDSLTNFDAIAQDMEIATGQDGFFLGLHTNAFRFSINHWDTNKATKAFTDTSNYHQVVGTYDKSNIRIFIDNIEGISAAYALDIDYILSEGLFIAKGLIGNNWDGIIEYLYIFNRALSAGERFLLSWNPFCFVEPLWPNRGALWEAVIGGIIIQALAEDGFDMSDSNSPLLTALALATDGFKMSDTAVVLSILQATGTDGFKMSDAALIVTALFASAIDGFKMSDSNTVLATLLASSSDGIKMSDSSAALSTLLALAADGFKMSDLSFVLMQMQAVSIDGFKIGDTALSIVNKFVTAVDGFKISDTNSVIMTLQATALDGIQLNDLASALATLLAIASDGFKMADISIGVNVTGLPNVVNITITGKTNSITFTVKSPSITLTNKVPGITWSVLE